MQRIRIPYHVIGERVHEKRARFRASRSLRSAFGAGAGWVSLARFARLVSFLWGAIPSARDGLTRTSWRWPALSARSCAVVGVRGARAQAVSFLWGDSVGTRMTGAPAWSRSGRTRIQPLTREHPGGKLRVGELPWLALASAASDNKSANTDPQLQEAASPQMLWSGYLQRYPS